MKIIHVAAAVIKKNNRIFAVQRGYGPFKGLWEFPGGKLEAFESSREAVIREIKEELDTDISAGDLIETVEYDYPDFRLVMDCFLCTVEKGELVLLEAQDSRWLDKDSIESVEWLPADKGLVCKIKEML